MTELAKSYKGYAGTSAAPWKSDILTATTYCHNKEIKNILTALDTQR